MSARRRAAAVRSRSPISTSRSLATCPSRPPTQGNITSLVEIKFKGDYPRPGQLAAYERIAPGRVTVLSPEDCGCDEPQPDPDPIRVPELDPLSIAILLGLLGALALTLFTPVPDEVPVGAAFLARLSAAFAVP